MNKLLLTLLLLLPFSAHAAIATPWNATSTDRGFISPNLINGNNPWLVISSTGTSTFSNGLNLSSGCFGINNACLTQGLTTAITSIGPAGQLQTGPAVTLATSTQSFNGLIVADTIVGSGNTITFKPNWSGTLNPAGINLTKGNFLVGDDTGVAQATSTIFISSTGQVGIGTTSPSSLFTSVGGLPPAASSWSDSRGLAFFPQNLFRMEDTSPSGSNRYTNTVFSTKVNQAVSTGSVTGVLFDAYDNVNATTIPTITAVTGQVNHLGSGTGITLVSGNFTVTNSLATSTTAAAGVAAGVGLTGVFNNNAGATTTGVESIRARIVNSAGATITLGRLFDSFMSNAAGGTITTLYGLDLGASFSNSGTIGNVVGVSAPNFTGGTITGAAGISIDGQAGATNNTNLLIGTGATIPTGNFSIYNASANNNYFAGNLGIGSTTPGSLLSIGSSGTGINLYDNATSTYQKGVRGLDFCTATKCLSSTGTGTFSGTTGQVEYFSGTNTAVGTSSIFIAASGNVGVGATVPATLLEVRKDQNNSTVLRVDNRDTTNTDSRAYVDLIAGTNEIQFYQIAGGSGNFGTVTNTDLNVFSNNTTRMTVLGANGFVGVATTTPWRTLAVTGTVGFDGLTGSAGLQVGILCLSANKEVINESVACVASAARYKKNVRDLTVGLDEVMKLRPVSFNWKPDFNGALKDDPNKTGTQYSLIADEVQKIDPNLVYVQTSTTTFEGKTYGPGTVEGIQESNHWVALLVNAIQDVEKQILGILSHQSDQDKKIQVLQAQVDALTKKVNAMKK